MSDTPDILFDYLSNIYYFRTQPPIDVAKIDKAYSDVAEGLVYLEASLIACNKYAIALSRGDLEVELPSISNEISAALKSLHASLKHITWQTQQVANGDYSQRVDFMGDFANAFNTMVTQLEDRKKKLEEEIEHSKEHAEAMERSQKLLSNLMQNFPQQIIVISLENREVLFCNEEAGKVVRRERDYVKNLLDQLPEFDDNEREIILKNSDGERYYLVNSYLVEWENKHAVALSLNDITMEKNQILALESHVYYDAQTGLYNRHFGMNKFNELVEDKKALSLIFIDLDNLKYINDVHGHEEGDTYIAKVAEYLTRHNDDSIVCRVGGDEFMILKPDFNFEQATARIKKLSDLISNDPYLDDKEYMYSVSYGVVEVDKDNTLPVSTLLGIADERMYEHKRARKKSRDSSGR